MRIAWKAKLRKMESYVAPVVAFIMRKNVTKKSSREDISRRIKTKLIWIYLTSNRFYWLALGNMVTIKAK
jgi:hypothetical protein